MDVITNGNYIIDIGGINIHNTLSNRRWVVVRLPRKLKKRYKKLLNLFLEDLFGFEPMDPILHKELNEIQKKIIRIYEKKMFTIKVSKSYHIV